MGRSAASTGAKPGAAAAVKGLAANRAPTPPGGTQGPAAGAANPARGGTPPLRAARAGTPPVGQAPRGPTPPVDPSMRGPAANPGMGQVPRSAVNPARGGTPPLRAARAGTPPVGQPPRGPTPPVDASARGVAANPGVGQPPRGSTPRASTPPVAAVVTKNTRRKDPATSWLAGRGGGVGGRGRGGGRVAGARGGAEAPAAALAGAADSLRRCLVGLLGERPYKRQAIEQARMLLCPLLLCFSNVERMRPAC